MGAAGVLLSAGPVTLPRMTDPAPTTVLDPETERRVAAALYNHVWDLLETPDRTPVQDEALLHAAHASRWHWGVIGGPEQKIVGDWLLSRAYAAAARGGEAVHYARMASAGCDAFPEAPDWLAASTAEGMARALLADGDVSAAREWRDRTTAGLAEIADPEDRELIAGQLAELDVEA
jgi:hypothetical protein